MSCYVMSRHVMATILDSIELEIAPFDSADPQNLTLEPNTKLIGRHVPETVI